MSAASILDDLLPKAPSVRAAFTPTSRPAGASGYAAAALTAEVEAVREAGEGTRNDTLNRAAYSLGQLVAGGELVEGDVVEALSRAGAAVGLLPNEIDKTIWSGLSAGAKEPRQAPPPQDTAPDLPSIAMPPQVSEAALIAVTAIESEQEIPRATWGRVDLAPHLDGTYTPPTPNLMPRNDGVCLLYQGLTHSFHGESESGKSWVAQAEVARCIKEGTNVLYVDLESDAGSLVERLLALGCAREQVATLLDYRQPETSPSSIYEVEAWQDMLAGTYVLAVIDGVTDAMGLFGKKTSDNDEIASWMRMFPRQLAKCTGAAVVMIDHVTKDKETRGRFAIGGQAKMAGLTGAAYTVDVVEGLGKGLRGVLAIRVAKDRPGAIRGKAGPLRRSDRTQEIARFILDSTSPHLAPDLAPWVGANGEQPPAFRPTGVMEKVSRLIETSPGMSKVAIEDAVSGRRDVVRLAVDVLVREGFVRADPAPRKSFKHYMLKPFRELYQPEIGADDE